MVHDAWCMTRVHDVVHDVVHACSRCSTRKQTGSVLTTAPDCDEICASVRLRWLIRNCVRSWGERERAACSVQRIGVDKRFGREFDITVTLCQWSRRVYQYDLISHSLGDRSFADLNVFQRWRWCLDTSISAVLEARYDTPTTAHTPSCADAALPPAHQACRGHHLSGGRVTHATWTSMVIADMASGGPRIRATSIAGCINITAGATCATTCITA